MQISSQAYRNRFYSAQNNAEKVEVLKELLSFVSSESEPKQEEAVSRQPTSDFYTVRQKGTSRQKLNDQAIDLIAEFDKDPTRKPTDKEKAILAKFSGFGGGLIDKTTGQKGSAYEYYTPKPIAEGVWDCLKNLGFNGGKVLDPSAGTGIFGATAPLNAAVDAVELSTLSGRVNQLVNDGPGYKTTISNFESVASKTPEEDYDAIVTNVPFGDVSARGANRFGDSRYQDEPLENYFILRSLEKLRPNGLAAFIVPLRCVSGKGGKPEELRTNASYMAEFVGAYRLPSGTFSTASTDVATDVIFFRKFSKETAEKIAELREQNAAVLAEAKVQWDTFIDGKYFDSAEGKPYVLGEFVAKDPTKFRDVDKVISNAGLSDLREILQKKHLPKSRINWELLETTETDPIVYNEGDVIYQAGCTLVMRNGVWVQLPKTNEDRDLADIAEKLSEPYKAFENKVSYSEATRFNNLMKETGRTLNIPGWLSATMATLNGLPENSRKKYWDKGIVALSVNQVLEEHSGEVGFDYKGMFTELSDALVRAKICKKDGTIGGALGTAMKIAVQQYFKKQFSDFWLGNVAEEVSKAEEVVENINTPEAKLSKLAYETQSLWFDIEKVKEIKGPDFDPITDSDWCISPDGKRIVQANDYYVGNYADFLEQIDKDIEKATDERIKEKLLRQKTDAEFRAGKVNVSRYKFDLRVLDSIVTPEEKVSFLKSYVSQYAKVSFDDLGRPYADIEVKETVNTTWKDKLPNRVGDYIKNGTITTGGMKFSKDSVENEQVKEQALKELKTLINRANESFNVWARSNKVIMARLEAMAEDPKNRRFVSVEDETEIRIPGMKPSLHLHGYQSAYVRQMGREFGGINGFGVGLGKAQPLDAKVLTPQGWTTMGEIKVGDLVMTRKGTPTVVTAIYPQGKKEIFEVTFSDGAKTRCCDEHLWLTQTENDRKVMLYHKSRGRDLFIKGTPKQLSEIRKTLLHGKKQKNHKIPIVCPVEFEERRYEIDPYVLGIMLGDGGMSANFATFTNSNEEVVSRFKKVIEKDFPEVALKSRKKSNEFRIAKKVLDGKSNSFVQALKHLNLIGCRSEHKFVPPEYLFGSKTQRIDLLNGLMDTDGYVSKDGITVQFNSSSRQLAEAVRELVQSLGGIAWIKVKKTPKLDSHIVSIRMPAEINPFSLSRKALRVKPKTKYVPVRYIVDVKSVGFEEAQCIQVEDEEHLYVTDDYIVTHNTFTALAAVQHVQAMGVKSKTVFVVPNSVLANWRKEASSAYTSIDDCLFVGLRTDKNGKAKTSASAYAEDLSKIKENKHSKIFMTFEAFKRIRVKDETIEKFAKFMRMNDNSYAVSEKKKTDEKHKGRLAELMSNFNQSNQSAFPYLEDLHIDSIVIDEAHAFKNGSTAVEFKGGKYLSLSPASSRGLDAQLKTWYVRGQSSIGDGVLMLTATPITNSPLEIFSMLSLSVGLERVNNAMIGCQGADDFLDTTCSISQEVGVQVDGMTKTMNIFTGLKNVDVLRQAIGQAITVKNAKDVGAKVFIPERDVKSNKIELDEKSVQILQDYKLAYRYATEKVKEEADKSYKAEFLEEPYKGAFERITEKFNEPVKIIGHPFNLIQKMSRAILDKELDEKASFYMISESETALNLAETVCDKFDGLGIKEDRERKSPWTKDDAILKEKTTTDKETGDEKTILTIHVESDVDEGGATVVNGQAVGDTNARSRVVIDSIDPKAQNAYEDLAEKNKLSLDVTCSPKMAALLENFKNEMAHPRGMISEEEKSPIVKQIIFCDELALHNKIKRLLSSKCGIPSGKIAIITGQTNNEPEQLQDVSDGFNAQGGENRYQVIIANEKAEVGINLQKGTQAIHHLTIGWTPDSLEQRNGRGARQGNKTQRVTIYYYDAEGTFDEARREMVNKKSEWISQVLDVNGNSDVDIKGGLSTAEQEALIEAVGDAEGTRKVREMLEAKEKEARILRTQESQTNNLDMLVKQQAFLEKYKDVKTLIIENAVSAFEIKKTLDTLIAKYDKEKTLAETKNKPISDSIRHKRETAIASARAGYEKLCQRLDGSAIFNDYDYRNETPFSSFDAFLNEFLEHGRPTRESLSDTLKHGWGYTITEKEDGELINLWKDSREQATSLIEQATKAFTEQSSNEGAYSTKVMDLIKGGNGWIDGSLVVTKGTFVTDKDGKLGLINSLGSDEVGVYIGTRNLDYPYASLSNYELILPGSSRYDEFLKKAAEFEDQQTILGRSFTLYSDVVPEVSQYRKVANLVSYERDRYKLPSPYFGLAMYDISTNFPFIKSIADKQREIVKSCDVNRFVVSAETEVIEERWNEVQRTNALKEYAKANALRPTAKELDYPGFISGYFPSWLFDLSALADHLKTPNGQLTVDEQARAWIKAQTDWINWEEVDPVEFFRDSTFQRIISSARKARINPSDTLDSYKVDPYYNVAISGNTYRWKNFIKSCASQVGDRARWSGRRQVWMVMGKTWNKMIDEKGREILSDLKVSE